MSVEMNEVNFRAVLEQVLNVQDPHIQELVNGGRLTKEQASALTTFLPILLKRIGIHESVVDGHRHVDSDRFRDFIGLGTKFRMDSIPFLCEVTSDGRTGEGLIASLRDKGFSVDRDTDDIFCSRLESRRDDRGEWWPARPREKFPETTNGVTYRLGLIFKSELGGHYEGLETEMRWRKATHFHPEVAALLREKFSQEELEAKANSLRPRGSPVVKGFHLAHTDLSCKTCTGQPTTGELKLFRDEEKDWLYEGSSSIPSDYRRRGDYREVPQTAYVVGLLTS